MRHPADVLHAARTALGCNNGVAEPYIKFSLLVDEVLEVYTRYNVLVFASELTAGVTEQDAHITKEEVALVLALAINDEEDCDVGVVGIVLVLDVLKVLEGKRVIAFSDFPCESVVHEVSEVVHFFFFLLNINL